MVWRYQKIYNAIWRDEKFIKLSEKAQFLFLYLLTGPHNNILGAYILPKKYIYADLNWSARLANASFNELISAGLILYDDPVSLLVIPKHLKHNTLENPNQITAAVKVLNSLPDSHLYLNIIDTLEQFGKQFHQLLIIQLDQRLPKPEVEVETESETGTELEPEAVAEEVKPPPLPSSPPEGGKRRVDPKTKNLSNPSDSAFREKRKELELEEMRRAEERNS